MAATCLPSSTRSPKSQRSECPGGKSGGESQARPAQHPDTRALPPRRRRSKRSRVMDADGLLEMFHCPYEGCSQVYVALSSFQVRSCSGLAACADEPEALGGACWVSLAWGLSCEPPHHSWSQTPPVTREPAGHLPRPQTGKAPGPSQVSLTPHPEPPWRPAGACKAAL